MMDGGERNDLRRGDTISTMGVQAIERLNGATMPALESRESVAELLHTVSLYLHIPFCHAKCHYCDFNSYAGMLGLREAYVDALVDEIALAGRRAALADGARRRCRTIFFGGGTPSLLTAEQVAAILNAARDAFELDADAEITLEANPGTLEYDHLDRLRATGVNRLSMGAQSFDPALLKWMGRIHSPEEIEIAFRAARSAGFDNVNLDFIFALPGQSLATWQDTLERAIALGPEHLSLYSLIVEEGTPLFTWVKQGKVHEADEDVAADMYEFAEARLATAGYRQYEISNWATPGHACQHNLTYWRNLPYIGLGAGAHGSFADHRYVEARGIRDYIARVQATLATERGERPTVTTPPRTTLNVIQAGARSQQATTALQPEGATPPATESNALPAGAVVSDDAIPRELAMVETAMVSLRLVEGLDLAAFAARFGCTFESVFGERLANVRALGLLEEVDRYLRLTDHGRILGNEVFMRLLPDE